LNEGKRNFIADSKRMNLEYTLQREYEMNKAGFVLRIARYPFMLINILMCSIPNFLRQVFEFRLAISHSLVYDIILFLALPM
jgi:hypothetical protein